MLIYLVKIHKRAFIKNTTVVIKLNFDRYKKVGISSIKFLFLTFEMVSTLNV